MSCYLRNGHWNRWSKQNQHKSDILMLRQEVGQHYPDSFDYRKHYHHHFRDSHTHNSFQHYQNWTWLRVESNHCYSWNQCKTCRTFSLLLIHHWWYYNLPLQAKIWKMSEILSRDAKPGTYIERTSSSNRPSHASIPFPCCKHCWNTVVLSTRTFFDIIWIWCFAKTWGIAKTKSVIESINGSTARIAWLASCWGLSITFIA